MTDERIDAIEPPSESGTAVAKYVRYALSLPERAVRSTSALVAGAARESASLLVPQSFQSSKTYAVMVSQMLDFLAEDVGGVARAACDEAGKVENFVARKSVGNFVEMASLATLHLSPLMLLAAVSDIAYGSRAYLNELADELKREGVIDESSSIHNVDELLQAVAAASRDTAGVFDTPPLSVEGLRETIQQTRDSLRTISPSSVLPQAEIARMWNEVREIAAREGMTKLEVSGAATLYAMSRMKTVARGALSSARVAGRLFDRHVIDHYGEALDQIRDRGVYATLRESSAPYVEAVWRNFVADKLTLTEDLLSGKLPGQGWRMVRKWLGRETPSGAARETCDTPPSH